LPEQQGSPRLHPQEPRVGRGLIDAIAYRRNRLLEVAEEVVARQRDFLDVGPPA